MPPLFSSHFPIARQHILFASAVLLAPATVALADSVPESNRLQQKAQEQYTADPVEPIARGNAHHRDNIKDEPAVPQSALPASPPEPPAQDDGKR
jgi:hypothetical protein